MNLVTGAARSAGHDARGVETVVAPRGHTVLGATVRVAETSPQADLGRRSLPAY